MSVMPINWISTYLYCKRKLYLEEVKNFKGLDDKYLLKKEIREKIYNEINFSDQEIVQSINVPTKKEDVLSLFRKKYNEIVQKFLKDYDIRLLELHISPIDYFHEIWPILLVEANIRSNNVFGFMIKEKIYSKELWAKLSPKILSLVKLEDSNLSGVVDRIEVYEDKVIPIEVKLGSGPKEGVWPGDRIQVESFIILSEKEFGKKVPYGLINYVESEKIRNVLNNEFIGEYIRGLIEDIEKTLKGDLPDFVKNRKKCIRCPLRERCYSIKE